MAVSRLRCRVELRDVGRVDRVVQRLTGRSRAGARGLFDHNCVQLNGETCAEPGTKVQVGDVVTVRYESQGRYRERPREQQQRSFRVVFEDPDLIVVDKAAAILTVPTDRGESNTLVDLVSRYLSRRGHRGVPAVVHRLDHGTSGLLVFGKNPRVGRDLREQFRAHSTLREYAAIVAGRVPRESGTFQSRLGTAKSLRRYAARRGQPGEHAVTHFQVQRRFDDATYLRVRLETGRRNQIRVHFAEAGHPVLGDDRYHPEQAHHPRWKTKRLALHAALLGFEHPRTHELLRFESPLPVEFQRFLGDVS